MMDFAQFCSDEKLLAEPISLPWAVAYRALDAEPLTETELALWRQLTGEEVYEARPHRELVAVKGRRAQGTKTACKYLAWKVHSENHRRFAPRGERLHAVVVAQTREVAREIMGYFRAFYTDSPLLSREVEDIQQNRVLLRNNFAVSVWTCSYRAPRGITAPLVLLDEVGVWQFEGSDVDVEVYRSVVPAMTQFPNAKLIMLGTPWARRGLLFDAWQRRRERPDRLLVHAPTPLMNPLLPREQLEREQQADPENYRREFLAEWTDAIDSFLPASDVDACTIAGRKELPLADNVAHYVGAIDAAGGGADTFVLAIGHVRDGVLVFDCLRGWRRQPLDLVLTEMRKLRDAYRLSGFIGDQFSHQALAQLFRDRGVGSLEQFVITADSKRETYAAFKLALAQGNVELLDHAESLRQLRALEVKRTSGGGVKIGAPAGLHDDFAAGMVLAAEAARRGVASGGPDVIAIPFAPFDEDGWTTVWPPRGLGGRRGW